MEKSAFAWGLETRAGRRDSFALRLLDWSADAQALDGRWSSGVKSSVTNPPP